MWRFLSFAVLSVVLLFGSGCDFEAPFQEKALVPMDTNLLGQWSLVEANGKKSSPDDEEPCYFDGLRLSRTEAVFHLFCLERADEIESYYMRAYLIDLGGVRYIQLQLLGSDDEESDAPYLLARYRVEGDRLFVERLQPFGDWLPETATPEALREAFLAAPAESLEFDQPFVFERR